MIVLITSGYQRIEIKVFESQKPNFELVFK